VDESYQSIDTVHTLLTMTVVVTIESRVKRTNSMMVYTEKSNLSIEFKSIMVEESEKIQLEHQTQA
jgi:hypothetical protein